jgi:hypothetical protein
MRAMAGRMRLKYDEVSEFHQERPLTPLGANWGSQEVIDPSRQARQARFVDISYAVQI